MHKNQLRTFAAHNRARVPKTVEVLELELAEGEELFTFHNSKPERANFAQAVNIDSKVFQEEHLKIQNAFSSFASKYGANKNANSFE